jgi:3-isopropylmalate/(R)-2-methylmalate dehydratase small subunit
MLAIELSPADVDLLFTHTGAGASISIDFENDSLTIDSDRGTATFGYTISPFDKALVKAGGWVDFADSKY